MAQPIDNNNQHIYDIDNSNQSIINDDSEFSGPIGLPIGDNISSENFESSKNILQALSKIILALNGGSETLPGEIRNIIYGDNDDLNIDPFLSFNIIKALDAIAESIYLKQQSSTDEEQTETQA